MKIHKSKKLNRQERIKYLETAINVIKNLRGSRYKEDNNRKVSNVVYGGEVLYSYWTIFWDIVIGFNLRK